MLLTDYDIPLWTVESDKVQRRYKDPGSLVCEKCPLETPEHCDGDGTQADEGAGKLRRRKKAPICPYAYAVWKLKYLEPVEAKVAADWVAEQTLLKGLSGKAFKIGINSLADRSDFLYKFRENMF